MLLGRLRRNQLPLAGKERSASGSAGPLASSRKTWPIFSGEHPFVCVLCVRVVFFSWRAYKKRGVWTSFPVWSEGSSIFDHPRNAMDVYWCSVKALSKQQPSVKPVAVVGAATVDACLPLKGTDAIHPTHRLSLVARVPVFFSDFELEE